MFQFACASRVLCELGLRSHMTVSPAHTSCLSCCLHAEYIQEPFPCFLTIITGTRGPEANELNAKLKLHVCLTTCQSHWKKHRTGTREWEKLRAPQRNHHTSTEPISFAQVNNIVSFFNFSVQAYRTFARSLRLWGKDAEVILHNFLFCFGGVVLLDLWDLERGETLKIASFFR